MSAPEPPQGPTSVKQRAEGRRPARRDSMSLEAVGEPAAALPLALVSVTAPRPLASVPMLLAFAAGVVGLIAAVFPTRAEYASLAEVAQPDQYSLAYLKVLIRANPEDTELRLLYVRQLATLGRWDESLQILGPVFDDPLRREDARQLRFEIALARARSLPEPSAPRTAAFEEVAALIPDLLRREVGLTRLRQIAAVALAVGKPELAAEIYARIAGLLPEDERPEARALAARWYLGAGNQAAAARYYAWASNSSTNVADAKRFALLELGALEQKDVELAADRSVAYAKKWWDDRGVVERATRLATSCDRPRTARDFGRRLVQLGPVDEPLLRAQAKRELAAGDSKAALVIIEGLLVTHPSDCRLHEARAILSEWVGNADPALEEWLWLADHACELKGVVL